MPGRREDPATRRRAFHIARLREATSEVARLWAGCSWLVSEARNAGRINEVTRAVLGLVEHVRERLPLPDVLHQGAARVVQPDTRVTPRASWRARGDAPTGTAHLDELLGTNDDREKVA